MSGGGGQKVAEYDPSVMEAELQNKRSELTDRITKRAFKSAKEANVYADSALTHLDEGLGLLSDYLSTRTEGERVNLNLSENARDRGTRLRNDAVAGAGFFGGFANDMLKQAQKADYKMQHKG